MKTQLKERRKKIPLKIVLFLNNAIIFHGDFLPKIKKFINDKDDISPSIDSVKKYEHSSISCRELTYIIPLKYSNEINNILNK